jgi:hypothetical protein
MIINLLIKKNDTYASIFPLLSKALRVMKLLYPKISVPYVSIFYRGAPRDNCRALSTRLICVKFSFQKTDGRKNNDRL